MGIILDFGKGFIVWSEIKCLDCEVIVYNGVWNWMWIKFKIFFGEDKYEIRVCFICVLVCIKCFI